MATIPYMPFYIADYTADTAHLSTLEHGAYLLLIMTYWQTQKPLPNDDKKLARICRLSLKKFQNVKQNVIEFFSVTDSFWHHKRIDSELAKFAAKSEQARVAGLLSAQKRKEKKSTTVERPLNDRSEDAERTLNHTDTDTDTSKEKKNTSYFSKRKKRAHQLPEDFAPNDQHYDLANELHLNVAHELAQFRDYWQARGSPMKDWDACFRTWLRKAKKFQGENHANINKPSRIIKPNSSESFFENCRQFALADRREREAASITTDGQFEN